MNLYVIFVEPESDENVGAIARIMKNFGFKNLVLVNPKCNPFSGKAFLVSKHASNVLKNAKVLNDIFEALSIVDIAVGTTGIPAKRKAEVLRCPLLPEEFAENIIKYKGKIGLFFGRESTGFSNEELELFDSVITIPASQKYPVLNVSHAVGIVLYEIFKRTNKIDIRERFKIINTHERFILRKFMKEVVNNLKIPEYKKPIFRRVLYNIIGRAIITKREFTVLAGFFREINKQLTRKK